MCVEIETYTTCNMHKMCVFREFSEKNLSPKICVETLLKIFKVFKSVLLLLLKRQCLML